MPEQVIDRGEIDKDIAVRVFDSRVARLSRTDKEDVDIGWHCIGRDGSFHTIPKYSDNLNAAAQIAVNEGVGFVGTGTGQYRGLWFEPGSQKMNQTETYSRPATAICMAALARKDAEREADLADDDSPADGRDEGPDGGPLPSSGTEERS